MKNKNSEIQKINRAIKNLIYILFYYIYVININAFLNYYLIQHKNIK